MFQVKRQKAHGHEDLMRELAHIEEQLLVQDSALAMNLMVLETKIRERFQQLEKRAWDNFDISVDPLTFDDNFSEEQIQALIPRDSTLPISLDDIKDVRRRKMILKTIGVAALLAVVTAAGVFTLASFLQFALSWIA